MNIFYLDSDIQKCVEYHNDKHVVKMIIEYVQLLSTTCRLSGLNCGYKITHQNHPCAVWSRLSLRNWIYLFNLTTALHEEWKYRYNHDYNHKSYDMMLSLNYPKIRDIGFTEPPLCMPDKCKIVNNTVTSYRNYYNMHKKHIAKWTKRDIPEWFVMETWPRG